MTWSRMVRSGWGCKGLAGSAGTGPEWNAVEVSGMDWCGVAGMARIGLLW